MSPSEMDSANAGPSTSTTSPPKLTLRLLGESGELTKRTSDVNKARVWRGGSDAVEPMSEHTVGGSKQRGSR